MQSARRAWEVILLSQTIERTHGAFFKVLGNDRRQSQESRIQRGLGLGA